DALRVRDRPLVEPVDLQLEPMEAELAEYELLKRAPDRIPEPAPAEAGIDDEPAPLHGPVARIQQLVRGAADALAVRLGDEPAERLRLPLRPVDVGEHLLDRLRREAEEVTRLVPADEGEEELGVRRARAPQLDGHVPTLPEALRSRERRRR